jgi:PEP-CTERM motif
MLGLRAIAVAAAMGAYASAAGAQQIIAPTAATINAGGPGFGSIRSTFNQAGLSDRYVSGVTDYDAYLATNPTHTRAFSGFEWFASTTAATVTYDLGAIVGIDSFALWNEEAAGIGFFDLLTSRNGVDFVSAVGAAPADTPGDRDYSAQLFGFGATDARFVRLAMSRCPQQPATFNGCAIGEVAFRRAAVHGAVPEPATWAMMLLGFGAIGVAARRRKTVGRSSTQAA